MNKNERDKKAQKLLDNIYREIALLAKRGESLAKVDRRIRHLIEVESNTSSDNIEVQSSTKDYNKFGSVISWGINEVAAHMQSKSCQTLTGGDLVSADVAIEVGGHHYDSCRSFLVPGDKIKNRERKQKLLEVSYKARELGISMAKPGTSLQSIREAVCTYVNQEGLYPLPTIGGHGIYDQLHHEPLILFGSVPGKYDGYILKEGDRITIEPIIAERTGELRTAQDGWSLYLDEDNLSAYWEETLEVTSDEPRVLTRTKDYFNTERE